LRGDAWEELQPLLPEADYTTLRDWSHPPLYLAQRLGEGIGVARGRGWLDPLHVALLEEPLSELINIQGACERIKGTPIPLAYIVLLHQLVAIYCLALPFALVQELNLYTPLLVLIVAYAFLGLDAIGDSIENPFEFEAHDLPLSALCVTIENNLRQQLGESAVPPLLPDPHGLLM
ncbi:MAG: bestrophin family protein, partial [Candidatus Sericytochromatia bacterium]